MNNPPDIVVIGAGMVGVSLAIHLQKRGRGVLLVDRREPGLGISYGNSGLIQRDGLSAFAFPRQFRDILRYHKHYRSVGDAVLNHSISHGEDRYFMAPMLRGIRLTTGVEFAAANAAPTPDQLKLVETMARGLFPLGESVEKQPWYEASDAGHVADYRSRAPAPQFVACLWPCPSWADTWAGDRPAGCRNDHWRTALS